jgi:hypothetical protein
MDTVMGTITLAIGLFVVAAPERAAQFWGSERLRKLTPQGRVWYLRWYRAFGVILGLAGILFALYSMGTKG